MTATPSMTVWLPGDAWRHLLLTSAVWCLAGMGWALSMAALTNDGIRAWMPLGLGWGGACWALSLPSLLIGGRRRVVALPLVAGSNLLARLRDAIQEAGYTLLAGPPWRWVGIPATPFGRFWHFDYLRLTVEIEVESIQLSGPARIVDRICRVLDSAPTRDGHRPPSQGGLT